MQGDCQLILCFQGMAIRLKSLRNCGGKNQDDDDLNTSFISIADTLYEEGDRKRVGLLGSLWHCLFG